MIYLVKKTIRLTKAKKLRIYLQMINNKEGQKKHLKIRINKKFMKRAIMRIKPQRVIIKKVVTEILKTMIISIRNKIMKNRMIDNEIRIMIEITIRVIETSQEQEIDIRIHDEMTRIMIEIVLFETEEDIKIDKA